MVRRPSLVSFMGRMGPFATPLPSSANPPKGGQSHVCLHRTHTHTHTSRQCEKTTKIPNIKVLVGASLGGAVAVDFAHAHPEAVEKLVGE